MDLKKIYRQYRRRAWKKRIIRLKDMYGTPTNWAIKSKVRGIKKTWTKQIKYMDTDPNNVVAQTLIFSFLITVFLCV